MKKIILFLVLVIASALVFCSRGNKEPASPPVATSSPDTPKAIPQAEAISGSSLNKAFPAASGDYKLVFTQEKDGFAQADLTKGGAKTAALTISDTDANPSARDKFKSSSRKIGGYPAAPVGSLGTAVLVADRFQVQVRSLNPSFTASDREAWIEKFKLDALAAVKK